MNDRWKGRILWIGAFAVMLAAASYQRRTGPTYEVRGTFEAAGGTHSYELLRSANTTSGAAVSIPRPGSEATGVIGHRRYPTGETFTEQSMVVEGDMLTGRLPVQPAAGKVEYYVDVRVMGAEPIRLPDTEAGTVVLRYKDPVPIGVLLPHVLIMFFSMLIGIRAGFAAAFEPDRVRRLAWVTLFGITVGGMILGPIVQKYAFGAYWTGFPFGTDLTDNKTLIMWVAWIAAVGAVGGRGAADRAPSAGRRATVVAAALVMLVVYLIPHSLRGSELDYEAGEIRVGEASYVPTFDICARIVDFPRSCRRDTADRALSRHSQRILT